MNIGDMEILAALNRSGSPYSSQEDVYLRINFKNMGAKAAAIPYLPEHPARYILKEKATGKEKVFSYAPPASPGTPAPEPHPEAVAEPGEPVTYSLLAQFPLGFIPAGKYALKYSVDFPGIAFTTDWIDFSVLALKVGDYSLNPSSAGSSECLYLTWSDLAATPGRILFQRSYIGEQKPLVPRTFMLAETDAPSMPVASISPAGMDLQPAWIGWISAGKLTLARVTGNDAVKSTTFPLPGKTSWSIAPNLNYSEGPMGKDPALAGILIGHDDQGASLSGFLLAKSAGPAWLPEFRPPPGNILAARLIPLDTLRHLVLWARENSGTLYVESMDWTHGKGFGPVLSLAALPSAAKDFKSMDAAVHAAGVHWGVALHAESPSGKASVIRVVSHSVNTKDNRTAPGIPKTRTFAGKAGPLQVLLKYDAEGAAWVLQRDVHGPWVQFSDWDDPIAVESPRGASFENLYFRNGKVPKVLWLHPDTGFESKGVKEAEEEVLDDEVAEGAE